MRVYMSGGISMRDEIRRRANELRAAGVEITARWLDERLPNLIHGGASDEAMAAHAVRDITDIDRAHYYVYHSHEDARYRSRGGGAHFETGYAYARDIPIIVVGQPRNVFHFLPHGEAGVLRVATWDEAREFLLAQASVPVAGYFAATNPTEAGHYGTLQPVYADQPGDVATGVVDVLSPENIERVRGEIQQEMAQDRFRSLLDEEFSRIMGEDTGPLFLEYMQNAKKMPVPALWGVPADHAVTDREYLRREAVEKGDINRGDLDE